MDEGAVEMKTMAPTKGDEESKQPISLTTPGAAPAKDLDSEIRPVEASPDDINLEERGAAGPVAGNGTNGIPRGDTLGPTDAADDEAQEDEKIELDQDTSVNVSGVYIKFIVSFLFVVVFFLSNPVQNVASITQAIKAELEESFWTNEPASVFEDVASLGDMIDYMDEVFIPKVYN
jgi:hypothetical protein